MTAKNEIGEKLTTLADKILDGLLAPGSEASLDQQIDAMKAIGALHLGMLKLRGKYEPEEDPDAASVPQFRRKLQALGNG